MPVMVALPESLDTESLGSNAPVFPVYLDKLRRVLQSKCGWDSFQARAYFVQLKTLAQAGLLTTGSLVTMVPQEHGPHAGLVVLRTLHWFANEPAMKRAHRQRLRKA